MADLTTASKDIVPRKDVLCLPLKEMSISRGPVKGSSKQYSPEATKQAVVLVLCKAAGTIQDNF